ncbi:uncharacterized protein LOC115622991 [Scaptodrosophila lebanonensis]|uniref:Uncharacterized protein LOC115622991 n=1 Tax=Drosophila lebanonensis TaxID=7225 RepID=A0A6J2T7U1_DROLE|nr:uncharacterized protein LOC115622991 [Scaptodrosophila lebanonensis]
MKSHKLHNVWWLVSTLLPLLMLVSSSQSTPLNIQAATEPQPQPQQLANSLLGERPMILIKHNVEPQHLNGYNIIRDPQGQPCLTISWKTNPDGSGPQDPQIYAVDGYFKLVERPQPQPQPQPATQSPNKQ